MPESCSSGSWTLLSKSLNISSSPGTATMSGIGHRSGRSEGMVGEVQLAQVSVWGRTRGAQIQLQTHRLALRTTQDGTVQARLPIMSVVGTMVNDREKRTNCRKHTYEQDC